MIGFHEKRRLLRILYSRYTLAFLCIPVGFMWYVAHNAYVNERASGAQKEMLEEEYASLTARASTLETNIAHLDDPYGEEQELRRRYDIGREGEEAIIFVEPDAQDEAPQAPPALGKTWWEKVKGWF